jgi:hypothetical protein
MSEESLQKIAALFKESKLHPDDQHELLMVIQKMPEKDVTELHKLFVAKPDWVYRAMDNLTMKRMAFAEDDENLLNSIIEEEEQQLSELE